MARSALLSLAVVTLFVSSLSAQRPDRVQAVLLHKGKDAFVHAVPLQPGHLITFTNPETGVMKPLLKAEPQSPAGKGNPPSGRSAFLRRRPLPGELIAGVAVDDERLYVLTATRVFQRVRRDDRAADRGPAGRKTDAAGEPADDGPADAKLIGHQVKLHAFALKDGAALMGDGYELALVNEDPKATEPPDTTKLTETLGKGDIQLVAGGVKCRGTTVIFAGNEVKSLEVKGKQFTPPPGFFVRDPDVRSF